MPGSRDHIPVIIEQFNGLWARGDAESAPSDHFTQADNIQYFTSGFETRDQITPFLVPGTGVFPGNGLKVLRMYNYVIGNLNTGDVVGPTLLVLFDDGAGNGVIWHIVSPTVMSSILTIPLMDDFGFVNINNRAYITPFHTYVDARGVKYQLGIPEQSVYVYSFPSMSVARKTGGAKPTGATMVAANGAAGLTDTGIHLFAVIYETNTGFLTGLGPTIFTQHTLTGVNKINLSVIPVSPDSYVTKRHIVATKKILSYNNDQDGYQFFFVPGGNIENNIDTTKTIEFFDLDLIDDASHLIDNFITIPAGVALNTYHDRLVVVGEWGTTESFGGVSPFSSNPNFNVVRVSYPGEPEAVSKIDGLLVVPGDGNSLTNVQEFRDILYVFRKMRTYAYTDNFDEPATWRSQVLDQALGAPVHGVATVHDSGGVNIDFLLIANLSGVFLFNGIYVRPELSWKIENFWFALSQNEFHRIQIVNNALDKKIWIVLQDSVNFSQIVLHADYADGLDAKNIKWAKWIFYVTMSTITLQQKETDILYFGAYSNGTNPIPPGIDPTHKMEGIYYLTRNTAAPSDMYLRIGPGGPPDPFTTVTLKIPDPTIRTALFGE